MCAWESNNDLRSSKRRQMEGVEWCKVLRKPIAQMQVRGADPTHGAFFIG